MKLSYSKFLTLCARWKANKHSFFMSSFVLMYLSWPFHLLYYMLEEELFYLLLMSSIRFLFSYEKCGLDCRAEKLSVNCVLYFVILHCYAVQWKWDKCLYLIPHWIGTVCSNSDNGTHRCGLYVFSVVRISGKGTHKAFDVHWVKSISFDITLGKSQMSWTLRFT